MRQMLRGVAVTVALSDASATTTMPSLSAPVDMLGQKSSMYARTNGVVPSWSKYDE